MYTKDKLTTIVRNDPSLSEEEKDELITKLDDNIFFDSLMRGATGAGVGYVIAKFLGLSRSARVLLSIAGFGIGRYLLDTSRKHDKFLQYNEKLKIYDIKA